MTGRGSPSAIGPLGPGAKAPGFALHDAPHTQVALEDLAGRGVVLVFHVADWDPVAVAQLRRLEQLRPHLERLDATVLGISVDTTWSHAAFARAHDIEFPLLADDAPPGAVARAYGVLAPASGRSARALFVIDPAGVIRWSAAYPDMVDPGADGILAALESFAPAGRRLPATNAGRPADPDLACTCGCGLGAYATSPGG